MYDVENNIGKGQDFNAVPECVRKEYTSREDYFYKLHNIIKNDKDTIKMFVDFLMSIDISEYRPNIFQSSTKDHLREMSKTPFEHFCCILDSTDEVDGFTTLNDMWKCIILKKEISITFIVWTCITSMNIFVMHVIILINSDFEQAK